MPKDNHQHTLDNGKTWIPCTSITHCPSVCDCAVDQCTAERNPAKTKMTPKDGVQDLMTKGLKHYADAVCALMAREVVLFDPSLEAASEEWFATGRVYVTPGTSTTFIWVEVDDNNGYTCWVTDMEQVDIETGARVLGNDLQTIAEVDRFVRDEL
jgi:hypothetical protein